MRSDQMRFFAALMDKCNQLSVRPNRTQIHKITFFVRDAADNKVPFDFALHNYGPYSFELDEAIQELTDSGDLSVKYDPEGYGASYSLAGSSLDEDEQVSSELDLLLGQWVDELARKGVRELELYATALYIARQKPNASRDEWNTAVRNIKPHFSKGQVSSAFKWLEKKKLVE